MFKGLNVHSKEHVFHFSTLHQYVHTAKELGHRFVWISHVSEGQINQSMFIACKVHTEVNNRTFCQGTFAKV